MATAYSKFGQFPFHIFANNASLNAGHHIVLINPLNFVHSGNINWHNSSLFPLIQHEGLGNIGTSPKRNEHNIIFLSHGDQMLSLRVRGNVYDIVDCAGQLAKTEHEQLLQGVPVGVVYARKFRCRNLLHFWFYGLQELGVLHWGVDWDVFLGLYWVGDIDPDYSLSPLFEFWHFLPRKLITIACYMNSPIIVYNKLSILIAPAIDLKPLLFIFDGLCIFNRLGSQGKRKRFKAIH